MRKRTMFKQGFTRVSDYFLECRDRRVKCDERDTAQSCSSRRQIACHSHRRRATCLEVCRASGTWACSSPRRTSASFRRCRWWVRMVAFRWRVASPRCPGPKRSFPLLACSPSRREEVSAAMSSKRARIALPRVHEERRMSCYPFEAVPSLVQRQERMVDSPRSSPWRWHVPAQRRQDQPLIRWTGKRT